LCGGAVFTFPLLSKTLASTLRLSQPQLTTIVLAGVAGQYPFSAFVGHVVDVYGPSICSLAASALFAAAFALFSREIQLAEMDVSNANSPAFYRLVIFFGLAGLGTVFGLFSALFSAARLFPEYIGAASGASMALFGLSPLFFTMIAERFFTDPMSGLSVVQYLNCLSVIAGVVYFLGALFLPRGRPSHECSQSEPHDERTPLLAAPGSEEAISRSGDASLLSLFTDANFWLLALTVLLTLGCSEMVLSNMGTLVLSFPKSSSRKDPSSLSDASDTATQVQLLSLSNTLSRLVAGALADIVSPMPLANSVLPVKKYISRMVFICSPAALLASVFLFMELSLRSRQFLWVLSLGVGLSYGTTFTVLPGIIRAVWGKTNEARNFGIISYAPMIGTPMFSYLYAFLSASKSSHPEISCYGPHCWQATIWVCFATSCFALLLSARLWSKWKDLI
jgi:MFS family permease